MQWGREILTEKDNLKKHRAVMVTPGKADSEQLTDVASVDPAAGQVRLKILEVGICGTDVEIAKGFYGESPKDHLRLIPGHESLAAIESLGSGVNHLAEGQLVVPIVRRPCLEGCAACVNGRWDLCLSGNYREHGIKALDGFLQEYTVVDADAVIPVSPSLRSVAVLVEPLTIVEKAMEEAKAAYPNRWSPAQTALVTGAGPVGMLAALLLQQHGMEVTILDQRPVDSPKAQLAGAAGIRYIDDRNTPIEKMSPPGGYHWIIEATGYSPLLFRAANLLSRNGVLVLTGVTSGHHAVTVDSDRVNSTLVLENQTIVGSVNAARHHYLAAAADLLDWADRWPGLTQQLITAEYPLDQFAQAYQKSSDGIKSVVVMDKGGQE